MSNPTKTPAIRPPGLFLRLWLWFRGLFRSGRTAAKYLNAAAEEATVPFSPPVVSKRVPLADLPNRPRLRPSMVTTARLPVSVKEAPEPTTEVPTPPELLSLPLPVSVSSLRMARLSLPIPARVPTLWTPEETQRFQVPRVVSPLEPEKEKPPWMVAGIKAARERFAQMKAEQEQAQLKGELESAAAEREAREELMVRAREFTAKRRQELAQEAAKAVAPQGAPAPERVPNPTQAKSPEPTPRTPEAKMVAERELESAIQSMPDAEEWEEPRNVVIDGSQTMQPVLPADMAPPTLVQARIQDDPGLLDLIKEFNAKHGDSEP